MVISESLSTLGFWSAVAIVAVVILVLMFIGDMIIKRRRRRREERLAERHYYDETRWGRLWGNSNDETNDEVYSDSRVNSDSRMYSDSRMLYSDSEDGSTSFQSYSTGFSGPIGPFGLS